MFQNILPFVLDERGYTYHGDDLLKQNGVHFVDLIKLEECGLLNVSGTLTLDIPNREVLIFDVGRCVMHALPKEGTRSMHLPIYCLTAVGKILLRNIEFKKNVEYYWDVLEEIRRQYPTWDIGYCRVFERSSQGIRYERGKYLTKEEFLKLFAQW